MIVLTAEGKGYFFGLFVSLRIQLFLQPFVIQTHSFQILVQNTPVHNHFRMDEFRRRRKIQVFGICRALLADGQNAQFSVKFEDGCLNITEIKNPCWRHMTINSLRSSFAFFRFSR